ncbi:5-formyltetrahydrofolate cyclo-ligase [Thioclava sp. GXIMD4216]|uniref:5-formyltetrahydrofolate cyclo-ligase n=1 Tax=Thioclava sp. GXIMD4216 TaxID=3131929 RepID=UPI0030CCBC48
MSSGEDKQAARKAAFAARKAAFATQGLALQANARLSEVLRRYAGQIVAGYMPIRTELDPRPALLRHDGPLCLPVVEAEARPLSFRPWSAEAEMIPGAFGAAIPAATATVCPQVVVVPLLAFDRRGFRLGYGGGFYDRTLEGLRQRGPVTAIGFAFAAQEMARVPVEATDQPLDLMVTETGVFGPFPTRSEAP